MAPLPVESFVRGQGAHIRPPPPRKPVAWHRLLFANAWSSTVTVITGLLIAVIVPKIFDWAILSAVWHGGPNACRAAAGACWAFIGEKAPQILLGIYPASQRWRPVAVIVLIVALAIWTLPPRNWRLSTLWAWLAGIALSLVLMGGGIAGLPFVPTTAWGGLPITLLLTVLSLVAGFPIAIGLALGRRAQLPAVRLICAGFVETVRGLPLLTMLFIASLLVPLMLPGSISIDNFFRALLALTAYAAAYLAEVLRGGLQAIPPGQIEAARALSLGRMQIIRLIVLPQAIAKVIPPLTSTVVVIVKNTSLVLVVGLFDLLSAGRTALTDPAWPAPYAETFLLVALVYFVICFSISRYAAFLERRGGTGHQA